MQEVQARKKRSSLSVTLDVWKALVLRDFISKTTSDRMGWFWMMFEPFMTVALMLFMREYIRRSLSNVTGANYIPWLIIGMFSFYLFRECMMSPISAIDADRSLFSYRQVKPLDPVIIRCIVAGMFRTSFLMLFVIVMLMLGSISWPYDSIKIIVNLVALWLLGSGIGILLSAIATLIPEIKKIMNFVTYPLIFLSGGVFPAISIPSYLRGYLSWNPILISIENIRLGFFEYYVTLPNLSTVYLWMTILGLWLLGLLMQVRFSNRFKMQ